MFLEQLGRLFFGRSRPLFFFILLATPLVAALWFLFLQYSEIQGLEERFAGAAKKQKLAFERKSRKEAFLKRYSSFDPYFINRGIESYPLLSHEKEKIEALLNHPAFPDSQALLERLSFLKENRFSFAEESIKASPKIKETEEKQQNVVQMDEQDLQALLALIESVPIGPFLPAPDSPQLLIRELRLKSKKTNLQTEVFEVEMNLLKREFIQ